MYVMYVCMNDATCIPRQYKNLAYLSDVMYGFVYLSRNFNSVFGCCLCGVISEIWVGIRFIECQESEP